MSSTGPNDPSQPSQPPPAPPYGQAPPPPYGQPATPPYGQPPHGQPPYGQPGYAQPGYGRPQQPLASWGARAGAYLLDGLLATAIILIPLAVGMVVMFANMEITTDAFGTETTEMEPAGFIGIAIMVLGYLVGLAFLFWNQAVRQGKTGQSLGKKWLGLKVVREGTDQPIGLGAGIGRWAMHSFVDGQCYIGFLWPLWDERRRTFGDMVVSSVVVRVPK